MKIAIDIRSASRPHAGKGAYTSNLVRELLHADHKNEYVLYTDELSGEFATFTHAEIRVISARGFLWHFAVIRDWQKRAGRDDLFFAPSSFIIPAFLPRELRSVITVHDLVAFLFPHLHERKATIVERIFFPRALKKTSHVLTPSHNTKRDLMRLFAFPEDKITVTPLAVDERFFTSTAEKKVASPFILAVGTLEPRKNLMRLIEAMKKVRAHHPRLTLTIAGGRGWKNAALLEKIAAASDYVRYIERPDTAQLAQLYRDAQALVFPSLYEGFGLPPLEAMASGCPVISSDRASLPEVCGEAALYIDPEKIEQIAEAIEKILTDKALRAELQKKGLARAATFSWKDTARKTLEVMV